MTGLQFLAGIATGVNLGYIRVVQIGGDNVATERTMDTMRSDEVANFTQKELNTYYKIGEYWYAVYNGG